MRIQTLPLQFLLCRQSWQFFCTKGINEGFHTFFEGFLACFEGFLIFLAVYMTVVLKPLRLPVECK